MTPSLRELLAGEEGSVSWGMLRATAAVEDLRRAEAAGELRDLARELTTRAALLTPQRGRGGDYFSGVAEGLDEGAREIRQLLARRAGSHR